MQLHRHCSHTPYTHIVFSTLGATSRITCCTLGLLWYVVTQQHGRLWYCNDPLGARLETHLLGPPLDSFLCYSRVHRPPVISLAMSWCQQPVEGRLPQRRRLLWLVDPCLECDPFALIPLLLWLSPSSWGPLPRTINSWLSFGHALAISGPLSPIQDSVVTGLTFPFSPWWALPLTGSGLMLQSLCSIIQTTRA